MPSQLSVGSLPEIRNVVALRLLGKRPRRGCQHRAERRGTRATGDRPMIRTSVSGVESNGAMRANHRAPQWPIAEAREAAPSALLSSERPTSAVDGVLIRPADVLIASADRALRRRLAQSLARERGLRTGGGRGRASVSGGPPLGKGSRPPPPRRAQEQGSPPSACQPRGEPQNPLPPASSGTREPRAASTGGSTRSRRPRPPKRRSD